MSGPDLPGLPQSVDTTQPSRTAEGSSIPAEFALLRKRQQLVERSLVGCGLFAVCIFIGFAYFHEGEVLRGAIDAIRSFESDEYKSSHNQATNCLNPKNRNLPYCQDRFSATESDWRSIVRFQRGRANPFPLTEAGEQ